MTFVGVSGLHSVESASINPATLRAYSTAALESVADAEIRDGSLARNLGRFHHAARSAAAESSGHENAVGLVEQARAARLFERLGLDPLDVYLDAVRKSAVIERLVEALVRIFVSDVLPNDVDREVVGRLGHALDEILPGRHPPFGLRQMEVLQHHPIETLGGQH